MHRALCTDSPLDLLGQPDGGCAQWGRAADARCGSKLRTRASKEGPEECPAHIVPVYLHIVFFGLAWQKI